MVSGGTALPERGIRLCRPLVTLHNRTGKERRKQLKFRGRGSPAQQRQNNPCHFHIFRDKTAVNLTIHRAQRNAKKANVRIA